jgi:hypothetical protein
MARRRNTNPAITDSPPEWHVAVNTTSPRTCPLRAAVPPSGRRRLPAPALAPASPPTTNDRLPPHPFSPPDPRQAPSSLLFPHGPQHICAGGGPLYRRPTYPTRRSYLAMVSTLFISFLAHHGRWIWVAIEFPTMPNREYNFHLSARLECRLEKLVDLL